MKRGVRIWSYFSLATDLAAEMRDWPEFVTGKDYDVELRDSSSGDAVSVRYVEETQDAEILVTGTGNGPLFDRVVGRVVHALSAHTDYLLIRRYDNAA
jgi:hypothetical protein